jgi:hypothetical protein
MLERIDQIEIKEESLRLVNDMEQEIGKPSYLDKYKDFIGLLSNHISIIAPFIPALSQLITN